MNVKESFIQGVKIIFPKIYQDERGAFLETYQKEIFKEKVTSVDFVQDNYSFSKKGVLRGLHFQKEPYAQDKLIKVSSGKVLDIVVDMREASPTFGRYDQFILDDVDHALLFIPKGLAHGFLALEDTVFTYKCSEYYNPESESGIVWNDKDLKINWGINDPIVSDKDKKLQNFKDFL